MTTVTAEGGVEFELSGADAATAGGLDTVSAIRAAVGAAADRGQLEVPGHTRYQLPAPANRRLSAPRDSVIFHDAATGNNIMVTSDGAFLRLTAVGENQVLQALHDRGYEGLSTCDQCGDTEVGGARDCPLRSDPRGGWHAASAGQVPRVVTATEIYGFRTIGWSPSGRLFGITETGQRVQSPTPVPEHTWASMLSDEATFARRVHAVFAHDWHQAHRAGPPHGPIRSIRYRDRSVQALSWDGTVTTVPGVDADTWARIIAADDPVDATRVHGANQPAVIERIPAPVRAGRCSICGRYVGDPPQGHNCPGPATSGSLPVWSPATGFADIEWDPGQIQYPAGWGPNGEERTITGVEAGAVRAALAILSLPVESPNPPPHHDPVAAVAIRRYRTSAPGGGQETLRMPAVGPLRDALRASGEPAAVPVTFQTVATTPEGDSVEETVTGTVTVARTGRGRVAVQAFDLNGSFDQNRQVVEHVNAMVRSARPRRTWAELRSDAATAAARLDRGGASGVVVRDRAVEQARARYRPSSSWSDDDAAFQAVYKAARARRAAGDPAVPYMRDNASGGILSREAGRGVGIELEFDLDNGGSDHIRRQSMLAALRREGVLHPNHPDRWLGYYEHRDYDVAHGWKCTNDRTVAGEIVSPILYDEPETWRQLEVVCRVARDHGAVITNRCGGHVHVSTGDFGNNADRFASILTETRSSEDNLFRLAANPDTRAHRGTSWCAPNAPVALNGYTSIYDIRTGNVDHHRAVSLAAVNGTRDDHVEFRMWDGSLDPGVIQARAKVSGAIVDAALAGRGGSAPVDPLGAHLALNPRRRALEGDQWSESSRTFRSMLDRLFSRDEDKAQVTALWSIGRWQVR